MDTKDEITTVIRPIGKFEVLDFRQLYAFRDLFWALGIRDIKLRYRQTALGVIWVILQPLMAAGAASFVFSAVAKLEAPAGIPYFIFAFAGQLGWNVFAQTVGKASGSLLQNSALVSKVFFPKPIVPISTGFSSVVDFGIALALLLVMLPFFKIAYTWNLIFIPIWLALFLIAAMGIGLYASALIVFYRDVQYVLPVLVQVAYMASPTAYAVSVIPAKYQIFVQVNPLTGVLEALRWSILGKGDLNLGALAYSATVIILSFIIGSLLFGRIERRFADVI